MGLASRNEIEKRVVVDGSIPESSGIKIVRGPIYCTPVMCGNRETNHPRE